MYNPEKKFLFIHVAKTGGTTVRHSLFGLNKAYRNENFLEQVKVIKAKMDEQGLVTVGGATPAQLHINLQTYVDEIGEEEIKDYFIFGMVRNPLTRLVSAYKFMCQRENQEVSVEGFDAFVEHWFNPVSQGAMLFGHHESIPPIIRPQYIYFNSEVKPTFIGRTEDFDTAYKTIVEGCGFDLEDYPSEWVNKSEDETPWQDFYSNYKTYQMVCDFYAEDFDRFGYHRRVQ